MSGECFVPIFWPADREQMRARDSAYTPPTAAAIGLGLEAMGAGVIIELSLGAIGTRQKVLAGCG